MTLTQTLSIAFVPDAKPLPYWMLHVPGTFLYVDDFDGSYLCLPPFGFILRVIILLSSTHCRSS